MSRKTQVYDTIPLKVPDFGIVKVRKIVHEDKNELITYEFNANQLKKLNIECVFYGDRRSDVERIYFKVNEYGKGSRKAVPGKDY